MPINLAAERVSSAEFRPNPTFIKVVSLFIARQIHPFYGYEICDLTGVRSGAVYPLLHELERKGWLESEWQEAPREGRSKPPKKLYRLTTKGGELAKQLIKNEYPHLGEALSAG